MAQLLDIHTQQVEILDRILNAHEKLKTRLLRVTRILNEAQIPYAVIGGNAVAVWVATRDESLVRTTRDVDILVRASDLDRLQSVLESQGFTYRYAVGVHMFLERPEDKAGDGVHLIFAGTYVRPEHLLPAPMVSDAGVESAFSVLPLEDLVTTKLVSWRRKDQVHLLDLIAAGLVDDSWPERFDVSLRGRLQELIDNPEG